MIHEDTDVIQSRVDERGQESTNLQLGICADAVRLTFSNLHVAQVGTSNELVNDGVPCCNHICNKGKPVAKEEDKPCKENSTPDEAAGVLKQDSGFSTQSGACFSTLSDNGTLSEDLRKNRRTAEEVFDVEYGMPLIRKQGSITGFKCETVMKNLEKLQDNGQFEAHEKFACAILESIPSSKRELDPDMRATLTIERGMALYYANDLRRCKQHFNVVIGMGDPLINRSLLEARALFLKSSAYRHEKKLNKALQCIKRAELLLSHHEPGEDKAELYYNYGALLLDMYSIHSSNQQSRKTLKEEAQKCFEKSIDFSSRDERVRVQLKRSRLSNLKLAVLYLDSGSKASWIQAQPTVLGKDVEAAKKHLDFVEYQLSDGMPLAPRVQLLMTRSDQHYRQGNLPLAREAAEEAIRIAGNMESTTRIPKLRQRLQALQTMEDVQTSNYEPGIGTSTIDSGWAGDCSSSE